MKIRLLVFLLLGCPFGIYAQGIHFFEGSFGEAKKEAAKQHRLLYVDCYETYCGPCLLVARDVFPQKEVGDFYNSHFVNYKVNVDKGEGPDIKALYHLDAYPTNLFLDSNGTIIHYSCGGSSRVAPFMQNARVALNDSLNYTGLMKRFNSGEKDTAFLLYFIKNLDRLNLRADEPYNIACEKALAMYWDMIQDTDLYLKKNLDLFWYSESNIRSKAYRYIYRHRDAFLKKFFAYTDFSMYGPMASAAMQTDSDRLYIKAGDAVSIAAETHDTTLFNEARSIVMQSGNEDGYYILCVYEIKYCNFSGQWPMFYKDADGYLAKYGKRHFLYNNFAWEIVKATTNPDVLRKGIEYAKTCIGFKKTYDNMDTYARLLYKLDRYDEALDAANEAITLVQQYDDPESTQKLIAEIKKAKGSN